MRLIFKILLFIFITIVVVSALVSIYKKVSLNMSVKQEAFEEMPKVKICLFYAVWCGHCEKYLDSKVFMTTYDDLKQKGGKFDNVVFIQYDYDKNKDLAKKYNVSGFPTILAISSDGSLLDEFRGDRYNKDELRRFVEDSLLKA